MIATRESRSHKNDHSTRAALGLTHDNSCPLTINYEEQEQANEVSGGMSV
jgi:hypothetical protein